METNNNTEIEQNLSEKDIISRLFVKKEKLTERLNSLVELSKGIVNLIEETGDVYIEDLSNLNNNDKILLFILGTYFANKSGLRNNPNMTLSEIAKKLAVPITTVPAPMKKLLLEGVVSKSDKGLYYLNFENYKKIKEILLKIIEKNEKS